MAEFLRSPKHRRSPRLEKLLRTLNDLLALSTPEVTAQFTTPQYPVLIIVGCARAGSTLLMQWLASLGLFAYPTNIISRFYRLPYVGALVQEILTNPDLDPLHEMIEFDRTNTTYKSSLGKTKGSLAPNEFWYFWRQFFPFQEIPASNEYESGSIDSTSFSAQLAAVESVFNKPWVMKGQIANHHIQYLNQILPKLLFIHIQRTPINNAQSLLEARKDFFGNIHAWYSFKPPEYETLKDMDPFSQVAGQVYFTNKAVTAQLQAIAPKRSLVVDYATFCKAPERFYDKLLAKLECQGWQSKAAAYAGPPAFEPREDLRLEAAEIEQISNAYARFAGT